MATPTPSGPAIVAAIPPPAGMQSNFTNPPTAAGGLSIFTAAGLTIAGLFLIMRLYTKTILLRKFGSEDVTIILAYIFTVATCTLGIEARKYGTGRHIWDVPVTTLVPRWGEILLASEEVYLLAIMSAKLAVILCYLRISPQKKFRIALYVTMTFVVSYHIALILALIFACHPIQKSWNATILTGHCINRPAAYLTNGILNVVSDFIILLLPLPMIKNIQMPLRQKILVASFFSVGSLACVISVVRLTSLIPILNAVDQTWVTADAAIWVAIELSVVITCGCLSVIRPFLRHFFPTLLGDKRSHSSSKYNKAAADFFYKRPRGQSGSAGSITQLGQPYHTDSSWDDTGYIQDIRATRAVDRTVMGKAGAPDDLEMNLVEEQGTGTVHALSDGAMPNDRIMMIKEVDVRRK